MYEKKRCVKCILPDSTPGITFDQNGICNYCKQYESMKVKGEEEFLKILDQYRNKGMQYDCMIGVSGGRDSSYLIWKLVRDYKMRVLAVHYNNPFNSNQAKMNLENALKILNVDCVKWEFKPGYHLNESSKALNAWSHNPSPSMLPIICAVCKNWWPGFFKIARENNISLIVIGSNPLESANFKDNSFGSARNYHKLSRLPKTLAKGAGELISNPRYLYQCSWKAVIKGFLMASHSSPYLKAVYKNMNVVRLFDYIEWNEGEVMTTIQDNLDWKKSPEHASPWRFDCRMDHIKKFLYQKTIGVSELEDLFSKMIRETMITREDALLRLEDENKIPIHLIENVLVTMDLKLSDLNWPQEWFND